MSAATMHHQLVLADLARGDGHDVTGEPGDCWRTSIACILGLHPATVPNFARFYSWMDEARLWLADRGLDYGVTPSPAWVLENSDAYPVDQLFIATGQSPRGDWRHCVVMNRALELIHDPHPSGDGLANIQIVELITTWPLFPRPRRLELENHDD